MSSHIPGGCFVHRLSIYRANVNGGLDDSADWGKRFRVANSSDAAHGLLNRGTGFQPVFSTDGQAGSRSHENDDRLEALEAHSTREVTYGKT